MKTFLRCVLLVVTLSAAIVHAQESISPGVSALDRDAIQSRVTDLLGEAYQVCDIVNVDSAIGNHLVAEGAITNPYNTLSTCFIFIARERMQQGESAQHGSIGVYKNERIIWQSGPTISASLVIAATISATRDLNDDGRIDIITSWFEGAQAGVERLWISSWDGQTGTLINALDETNQSVIISTSSAFEYVDVDGDNVYEITGEWYADESEDEMTKIVYSWNGTQYGRWAVAPQPLPSGFYPRDRVDASVRAVVQELGDQFSYQYELQSEPSSKQMINEFLLEVPPDSIDNYRSPVDWRIGGIPNRSLGWLAIFDLDELIKPGSRDTSFYFESKRLPAIVRGFVRGKNASWVEIFGDSVDVTLEQWYEETKENSFKILTLGPSVPPSPFAPLGFLDTLTGFATQSRSLGWIKDQATSDKYLAYFATAKSQLQSGNTEATRATLQTVLQNVDVDSTSNLTSDAYALLRYNTEYLLSQLPTAPPPGLVVKLVNSAGSYLTGGSLQYYDGSWKDAVDNGDGTFTITTSLKTLSLRMMYAYGSQTKSNVSVGPDTVVFQTVNTLVKLRSSTGSTIDTGTVRYYFSAWKDFGVTSNGVASKELLPATYTFRMTYTSASNDKQQDIGGNSTVVFQTVNAAVHLQNSQGTLMDQGTVQYYSSSWKYFGVTTNGISTKELLPGNYTFRMSYASATNDKQQNIGTNPTVVFQTVSAAVQLQDSQGALIDTGVVRYYFSSWQNFGTTANGVATRELLPANYTFRMSYASATKDKQQNIGTNPTVVFNTVNAIVQLKNSQGAFIDQGAVQYYFNSWKSFGVTTNGVAVKQLLPGNYTFRMTYETVTNDKVQDISANNTVGFSTVLCTVRVRNSQSQPVDGALISYYFSLWRQIGTTANGGITKELLPANMTFRMTLGPTQQDKVQNIATNALVEFSVQ